MSHFVPLVNIDLEAQARREREKLHSFIAAHRRHRVERAKAALIDAMKADSEATLAAVREVLGDSLPEDKPLTIRQRKAAELLANGATVTEAARQVGVNRRTISNWRKRMEFALVERP